MEIKIDLKNEDDVFEKYDNTKISLELIDYLINKASFVRKKENIKIVINNQTKTNLKDSLYEAFKLEYQNTIVTHLKNNIIEVLLLFLGLFFLFLSTQISKDLIWKEILLIGGWVPIWEMIDLELFNDFRGHKRKKILTKLISSNIEENHSSAK